MAFDTNFFGGFQFSIKAAPITVDMKAKLAGERR